MEEVCQMNTSGLLETAKELGQEVDDGMQKSQLLAKVVKCLTTEEMAEKIGVGTFLSHLSQRNRTKVRMII